LSRIALVFLLALQLAACGFHLRGSANTPPEMSRTYISTKNQHTVFYRKIKAGFHAAGVQVVDTAADATAIFTILEDNTGQRVVSVSARNVPREYEIWYTVHYELTSGEKTLIPQSAQTLTRDYTYNETEVLGKAREEDVLRDALADDLVRIALIQVSAL
jgi:LPS-assembly lipoprotein